MIPVLAAVEKNTRNAVAHNNIKRRGVIVMIDLYEEKQIINAMTTKLKEMGNSL
jgi:hypothetical protein